MSFFKRLFKIGEATANKALDNLEDPTVMLDQLLRDMDQDVRKVEVAVQEQLAVEKRFEHEYQEAIGIVEKREKQAQQAVSTNDDVLALDLLKDKKAWQEKADARKTQYEQAKVTSNNLRKQLADLKSKFNEMKAKKSTLSAEAHAAKARKEINDMISGIGSENTVASFERMEEKVEKMKAKAEASEIMANEGKSLDDRLKEATKNANPSDLEDELAALKAKMNK